MSLNARRELLAAVAPRYQQASKKAKQKILDEFTTATGYHRKYAIALLKQYNPAPSTSPGPKRKPRSRRYTEAVKEALIRVWEAANRICSKRLVPFLPTIVEALERHGHLSVEPEVRARLLTISPATVDRLLADVRRSGQARGMSTTKPGLLLKHQIPIRTFADWNEEGPGFLEADLVAHCGDNVRGSYLHTLVMTDIAPQWTECLALLFRGQMTVLHAVQQARTQLPFPLLGLDTDNGSEFLNYTLWLYCSTEKITFTRSRPYKKNDQCHVEQKNGSVVRKFVGYDRLEGPEPCRILSELYGYLRLYLNFYQPSLKLVEKKRQGAKVIRKYDQAQTPYQRVLATDNVPSQTKQQLQEQFLSLEPVYLLRQIHNLQDQLWQYAFVKPTVTAQLPAEADLPPATPPTPPLSVATNGKSRHNGTEPELSQHHPERTMTNENISPSSTRMYHRSNPKRQPKPVQRWWRTRKDPFEAVWPEVEQLLEQSPHLQAKALFEMLRQKHPDQFTDGQLRTFQRRVKQWRTEYVSGQLQGDNPQPIIPISDDNHLLPG